jgi:DNA-repair protein complementing XP-A cells
MDRSTRTTRSQSRADAPVAAPPSIAPDVARRIEESRLRAKAIRQQRDAELRAAGKLPSTPASSAASPPTVETSSSSSSSVTFTNREADLARAAASRKRPLDATATDTPGSTPQQPPAASNSNRDGRLLAQSDVLRPAKKFARFVDYNMDAMVDTKGGFLSAEDDPTGEAARLQRLAAAKAGADAALKPKHMTEKEWERLQLIRNLQRHKAGPFEPGLSVLEDDKEAKKCRECGSRAIDWVWEETFGCCVCAPCKEQVPEKYSLLTKTECREDYLLTEREFFFVFFIYLSTPSMCTYVHTVP